ncbi:MAG: transposase [endosymbiont of Escarpia spicata]|uniref:Transposase n=1 Tax=endosymbiont of Escarpia spicata TaxID=2200908 RepID=A0A370DRD9_9GAMM|nr:MAG: transposase [endosymbiont of Escarpia spicata]
MPRKPRMYLPGVPCHIVQRGNNREATFFSKNDYLFYLACLKDGSKRYGVAVHAYALMTNLLLTPKRAENISRLMQSLGRRYVQYINKTYQRTGTLWESRHKASLVQEEEYLLKCYRYIELNPVRAGMVEHPGDYPWTSFQVNGFGRNDSLIQAHQLYTALGLSAEDRQNAYRDLSRYQLDRADIHAIRNASSFSMPLGNGRFRGQIEQAMNRKIGYASRGRPVATKTK